MASTLVSLTREQGYALIQLNRPDVLNAISRELLTDLVNALEESDAGPTRTIGLIKRILNRALVTDLNALLEYEAAIQEIAAATNDHREGVAVFLEKRKGAFIGS